MTKPKNYPGFNGHRFPPEIIQYAVWLYFRFSLRLRDVEDFLAQRGIIGSHETVRFGVAKFGRQYAKSIRRDRPQVGDKWHLDEVAIGIRGKKTLAMVCRGSTREFIRASGAKPPKCESCHAFHAQTDEAIRCAQGDDHR